MVGINYRNLIFPDQAVKVIEE